MAEVTLSRDEYSYTAAPRPALSDWAEVVKEEEAKNVSLLGPIMLGVLTLVVGVGGFVLWAVSTELSSASVASGKVVVESNTKTVTHLEGGTLKALLVHEGELDHPPFTGAKVPGLLAGGVVDPPGGRQRPRRAAQGKGKGQVRLRHNADMHSWRGPRVTAAAAAEGGAHGN